MSFDKVSEYSDDQELDMAGIVKMILRKEESNSSKLKLTMVVADPKLRREIDAVLYMEP